MSVTDWSSGDRSGRSPTRRSARPSTSPSGTEPCLVGHSAPRLPPTSLCSRLFRSLPTRNSVMFCKNAIFGTVEWQPLCEKDVAHSSWIRCKELLGLHGCGRWPRFVTVDKALGCTALVDSLARSRHDAAICTDGFDPLCLRSHHDTAVVDCSAGTRFALRLHYLRINH